MNYKVSGSDLTSVANAIRTKGSTSSPLEFPSGFVTAIQNIPSGGSATLITKNITTNGTYSAEDDDADGYSEVTVSVQNTSVLSGSFTCPSSGSSYELSFGKTINKYMFLIEMDSSSKTELINSGISGARTYAIIGISPKTSINSADNNYQTLCLRYNASSSTKDTGAPTTGFSYANSGITIQMGTLTSGAHYLYRGLTYNYLVFEMT